MNSFERIDHNWVNPNSSWELVRGKYLFNNLKELNIDFKEDNLLSLTLNGVLNKNMDSGEGLRPETYETYQIFEKDNLVFKLIDLENVKTSRVGWVHERGLMSPVYIRLESNTPNLNTKYYYHYYYDLYKREIYNSIGSGVRSSLSGTYLLELLIPTPSIEEQNRIVRYIEKNTQKIDELIKKIEQKIKLLTEQKTSLINEVVTKGLNPDVEMKDSGVEWIGEIPSHWRFTKLKYYLTGIKDGTHGTHKDDDDGEILLSSKNVLNNQLHIGKNERRVSTEEHKKIISNGYPFKGDLLVTSVGSIGRCCVFEKDEPISFQRSVCFLRPKKDLDSYFLSYSIQSNTIQFQFTQSINKSTLGGLYMNNMKDVYFCLPPKEEQGQINSHLDKETKIIDESISKEEKRITLLKEYKQSLISEVVTGKKRVTEDMV